MEPKESVKINVLINVLVVVLIGIVIVAVVGTIGELGAFLAREQAAAAALVPVAPVPVTFFNDVGLAMTARDLPSTRAALKALGAPHTMPVAPGQHRNGLAQSFLDSGTTATTAGACITTERSTLRLNR